ncbi:MAG: ABC transporter permease [Dehalococcoidia bacterium]|nr:ABC transporter permease [Dehalococcoidia bacterium]
MDKTLLILKHEFLQMIKRKAFIIMTIIFPLLALAGILGYTIVQDIEHGPSDPREMIKVGYVDETDKLNELIEWEEISLIPYHNREAAKAALLEETIEEYIIIPPDYIDSGNIIRYTTKKELEMSSKTWGLLRSVLLNSLLAEEVEPEILKRAETPIRGIQTTRLDEFGQPATDQGGFGAFVAPFVFAILLVISIFNSSGYLLQGLAEEKENRVMEILLSSVSPRQLLTGKIVALGAAGLLQMIIWLTSAMAIIPLASSQIGGIMNSISISTEFLILGIVYFILGYLLFATIMATIGAIATSRENTQIAALVNMSGAVPLWISSLIISNPDHVVAKVFTFIPVTSPVMVMLRLGLSEIPTWELGVSIAILVTSVILAMMLAAKVLRTFLLMYGKQPGIREIFRLIRRT